MGESLRDIDVRQAAHRRLLRHARSCPDTLVIDELGLAHGASRIDIAVINGHIRGIEIKAEADRLTRLSSQVDAYSAVVDRASLIVAPRHLDGALKIVPDWWGVIMARRGITGAVVFERVRVERANRNQNPLTLAQLLWHPEVSEILRDRGHPEKLLRSPRRVLYDKLVAETPRRVLAGLVRDALKSRAGWRGQLQPS